MKTDLVELLPFEWQQLKLHMIAAFPNSRQPALAVTVAVMGCRRHDSNLDSSCGAFHIPSSLSRNKLYTHVPAV